MRRILEWLRELTLPDHNWTVINGMAVIYILLVFPGWYLLARQRTDYRLGYMAIIGTAALFCLAFQQVGKRGYGEATSVDSVAISRPVSGGASDVTQWTNVFVTSGDTYTISHRGSGQLYSTCQPFETAAAVIDNGLEGTLRADIPLFSSRTFMHRYRLPDTAIQATVTDFRHELRSAEPSSFVMTQLALKLQGNVPKEIESIELLHNGRRYGLSRRDDILEFRSEYDYVVDIIKAREQQSLNGPRYANSAMNRRHDPGRRAVHEWEAAQFKALKTELVLQLLRPSDLRSGVRPRIESEDQDAEVSDLFDADESPVPEIDRPFDGPEPMMRLLIWAPMSSDYFIQNPDLGKQGGYVLHVVDIPVPKDDIP